LNSASVPYQQTSYQFRNPSWQLGAPLARPAPVNCLPLAITAPPQCPTSNPIPANNHLQSRPHPNQRNFRPNIPRAYAGHTEEQDLNKPGTSEAVYDIQDETEQHDEIYDSQDYNTDRFQAYVDQNGQAPQEDYTNQTLDTSSAMFTAPVTSIDLLVQECRYCKASFTS